MNNNESSTHKNRAAQRAEAGTADWEDAVRLQLRATPDHADFYVLAGQIVMTLRALEDLTRLLRGQVAGYGQHQQAQGRQVYDDTRQVDPTERLQDAEIALEGVRGAAAAAGRWGNAFWSAIGHIGVEAAADVDHPASGGASDGAEGVR